LIFSSGYLATYLYHGVDMRRDDSKHRAKEWFFLYERGKELGREELEKENAELKVENEELKNLCRVLVSTDKMNTTGRNNCVIMIRQYLEQQER